MDGAVHKPFLRLTAVVIAYTRSHHRVYLWPSRLFTYVLGWPVNQPAPGGGGRGANLRPFSPPEQCTFFSGLADGRRITSVRSHPAESHPSGSERPTDGSFPARYYLVEACQKHPSHNRSHRERKIKSPQLAVRQLVGRPGRYLYSRCGDFVRRGDSAAPHFTSKGFHDPAVLERILPSPPLPPSPRTDRQTHSPRTFGERRRGVGRAGLESSIR